MNRRKFASLLLALLILGIFAVPALAVPPDRLAFPNSQTYEVADCGDFQVINHEQSTIQLTFFYDQTGNLIRVNQLWSGTDSLTNSVTGASILSRFHNHAIFDLTTSTVNQSGVFWQATVPHEGTVYFQAGQIVAINFDEPDPQIVRFTGIMDLDEDALCAALDA